MGSSTLGYDVLGFTGEFVAQTMVLGRGVFVVTGFSEIQTFFAPGVGGVNDGTFGFSVPAVASAGLFFAPEPGTGFLLALGLVGLAARRQR